MPDPRHTHDVDQLQARLKEMAGALASVRRELASGGVPEDETWALVRDIESKWSDLIFEEHRGKMELRAWQTVLARLRNSVGLNDT